MNRQEIIDFVRDEFDVAYEQLWINFPNYLVFRNRRNKKWFAIMMDIERAKLGLEGDGKIDVVNLRCDPLLLGSLRLNPGYLPAYHMSKKNWVTVLLDGTVGEEELKSLVCLSYDLIDEIK